MSDVIVVGSFVQDLSFRAAEFPSPGETRIGSFTTGPGGKGFNQAVACHRQGVDTRFVGAIGDDAFAEDLRGFLAREGLPTELQVVPGSPCGAASIVVNEKAENLIVVALGANEQLSEEHIDALEPEIRRAEVLVVQLESNLAATRRALEIARRHSVVTLLNPAPIHPGFDAEMLKLVDILVPNETECAYFLEHGFGVRVAGDLRAATPDELAAATRHFGVARVVVTLGEHGAVVVDADGPEHEGCRRVAPIQVQSVDTTGAGDAFCGGLAAGLVRFPGRFRDAVGYATVVAGLATEQPGTAPAMPSRERVEHFIASHPENDAMPAGA